MVKKIKQFPSSSVTQLAYYSAIEVISEGDFVIEVQGSGRVSIINISEVGYIIIKKRQIRLFSCCMSIEYYNNLLKRPVTIKGFRMADF